MKVIHVVWGASGYCEKLTFEEKVNEELSKLRKEYSQVVDIKYSESGNTRYYSALILYKPTTYG
jgi:hypothetical protein